MAVAPKPPEPIAPLPYDQCAQPELTQALLPWGDSNSYALAPAGDFTAATGWELAQNATMTLTTQQDGTVGGTLDLPGKGQATSPPMCITQDYPHARLWVRTVSGKPENANFYVVFLQSNGTWGKPVRTSQFKGDKNWTLSNDLFINPAATSSWQQVRFIVQAGDHAGIQVDNLWVDPRASR